MSEYIPIEKKNYSFYKWIHANKDLEDLIYVGSTANLTNRKRQHKQNCINPNCKLYNSLLYSTIRNNGGIENFKMVILGIKENITKREAQTIEEEYRIAEKANLNSRKCYISKEELKLYHEQYRKTHKEELKLYNEQYRETHKQETKQYSETHKKELKLYKEQYRETHREEINLYNKQYRENKKIDKIIKNLIEKIERLKHV